MNPTPDGHVKMAGGGPSERRRLWIRFARSRTSLAGMVIVILALMATAFGPAVIGRDPHRINLSLVLAPPSAEYPFGTDQLGRCVLTRILHGGRISMTVGLVVVSIAMVAGTAVGSVSGYVGGRTDEVVMRLIDILMAFPGFLLALLVISILGPGLYEVMIAVGLSYIPRFVRLVRASTLSVKEMEYVQAAHAVGQRAPVIVCRHILPNILGPIIVQATLLIGMAILIAASLGFLGLGVQPPKAEWGNMLSQGRDYMQIAPHVVVFPGLAILVVVLAFNLMGDGLRDALDVKLPR